MRGCMFFQEFKTLIASGGAFVHMKACLVVAGGVHQGKTIPIPGAQFLIGRDETCHLRPASPNISNKHCILFLGTEKVTVVDLGSTNGTFVNGRQVKGEIEVSSGDVLKVGPLEFFVNFILVESNGVAEKPQRSHPRPQGKTMSVMEADAQEETVANPTTSHKSKTVVGSNPRHPKVAVSPPKTLVSPKTSSGVPSGAKSVLGPKSSSSTGPKSASGGPPKTMHGSKPGVKPNPNGSPPPKRVLSKTDPVLDLPPEEPEEDSTTHDIMEPQDPSITRPDGTTLVLNLDGDTSTNPSIPEGTTVTDIPAVTSEEIEAARDKAARAKVGLSDGPRNKPKVNTSNTLDTSVVAMSILNKYSMMRGKKPPAQ